MIDRQRGTARAVGSVDEEETALDVDDAAVPRAEERPPTPASADLSATAHDTTITDLALADERAETNRLGTLLAVVCCAAAATLALFAAVKDASHWALIACLAATAAVGAQRLVTKRAGTTPWFPFLVTLTVLAGIARMGPVSAAVAFLLLIVYFMGTIDQVERRGTILALAAGGYAVLVGLSAVGVLPLTDRAFALAKNNVRGLLIMGTLIELTLFATYFMARRSRRATIKAINALDAARQQIHQREALLNEARADLAQAENAGRAGRYSGALVGPYRAGEIIGRGGMGEVYAASHEKTGEPSAVKVLHAYLIDHSEHVARFFREAQVIGALATPNVVKTLGTGYADDGAPFIAMELLNGEDLSERLRAKKRLPLSEVIALVQDVAAALSAAQEAGIVHRDIKPQNVFLASEGSSRRWKVLDFGVSKMMGTQATLTHGAAVGTPSYMSPEQARGQDVDHRSDVFALGAIAYRALTGRPAFTAPDAAATLYAVVHAQPEQPSALVPLPDDVDALIALVLAKDRDKRLRSAQSFAASLRDAARSELDPRLREAAEALLRTHPWGSED